MREENWFIQFLKRIGIIKEKEIDIEESNKLKIEMCNRCIKSGVCPGCCDCCAWNVRKE